MSFIVKKQNNKLIFKDLGGCEQRNPSTFWCIQKADEKYNWKDFKEIKIFTEDYERNNNNLTYSNRRSYQNLVPDFNFHAWPAVGVTDYSETVELIHKLGLNKPEIEKVGWIGNLKTNTKRKVMYTIGQNNKELFDFISITWTNKLPCANEKYLSMPDLVKKYQFLIDIEGNGYSGRLKYLLWSHRPLLLVDRPHKEFFSQYLEEWKHYIPVKRDLTDLIKKTNWCIKNYSKALEIAENAYQFSLEYLTRESCYKQWDLIISKFCIK